MVLREHNDVLNQSRGIMGPLENQGALNLQNNRGRLKQRFDLIRKLGQGTYGKVQLGIDKETGQEVAIKTIKKSKIETEADLIRIRREIQIMSSVRHPNIIHIYEVFENREKMVLVMEFAAGGELYDYLNERKILTDDEARRVFRQIASAVYYCHKHKICHRDLKLENILLDNSGNAKIADFGLSNVFDDIRLLKTFCGSPLYASPEIVRGTPYYGPEVDCWSLGVLLYTLVYGAMPFDGSNFKRLVKQISSGDFYEPKKAAEASPLIRLMLTVDPLKRASIKDVCSNPWVNRGYDQPCLNIAEDLANQTPVRLDLLLSLVPTSKINQNAIMIEPSTSTGGANATGATTLPSTSGHQHSSKESGTKKEAPPKPKRKVMPSTSNSGSQVVKSKKSKSSPMLELILDVDEDELPPPSPAKVKPSQGQVNNENDEDDDAADTLSEISEIQTIAEDSEITSPAPIKTPKIKPTPKNDKIDKPDKEKKREKSPQKPVQVQVPEPAPLENDISSKQQGEREKVGLVKKVEKKDPSKKVVEKKKEAKTEQTQMIPSNESTSKKDEIIAKEKTPEIIPPLTIAAPIVNDKDKEKAESNLIKSSPQTTPPVKKKVVKVKLKEKSEAAPPSTAVEKEKTPNLEEDKDQKKLGKNEAVNVAKKEQAEKVHKETPDEIKASEESKNNQEDGEPRREKLNRSNSITSQGDKSENVSPTRIERRSSKIISQKTAELIKNLDTKQSTTNGSVENKIPPPKKLVFSAFKVSDAKNKFEAKPPKPIVSKPNLPTPPPQNQIQKMATNDIPVPKEPAKEKIEAEKIPLAKEAKDSEPTKINEVENKEKGTDKQQDAIANKTTATKTKESSTTSTVAPVEVKPLATSDSKSKLLEPTTGAGVDEIEKKSPKTSPRPKKKIEKRATAPLPLKKVEDSSNGNDLKIPSTIPEKAKSKSPERPKPLAAHIQLEKLKMPSNRQEIKPVFIDDGSGSPKSAMMLVSGKTTPPSNFTSPEQYSRNQSRNQSMSPEPSSASISISSKPPNFQRQQSKEQAVKNICSVIGNKVKPEVKPTVKTEVVFPISAASTSVSTPTSASVKERIIPIKIETDGEANSVTSKSASVPKLPSSTITQAPSQVKKSFSTEPTPTPSATATASVSNQNPFTFSSQNSHFSRQNSSDTESSMASSAPILNKPKDQPNLIRSKREFIIPIMMDGHTVTPKEDVIANSPDIDDDKFRIDCGRLLSGRFGRRSGRFSSLLSDSSLDEDAPSVSVSASNSRRSSTAAPSLHTRSQSQGDEPKTPQTPQPDTPTGTYKKFRSKRGNTVDRSDSFSSIEDDEEDNFEVLTAESLFSNLLDRVRSLTRRLNQDSTNSVGPNFSDPFWTNTNTSSPLREFMSRASSEARTFSPTAGRTTNISIGLPGSLSRRSLSRDLSADSDHGSVFSDPGQSGRGGNGSLYGSCRKFDSNNNTSSSNSIRSLPTRRTISCGAPSSYLSGINENSPTTFYNKPSSPGSYCGSLGRSSGGGSAYSSRSSTPLYTRSMSNADYTHNGQNSLSSIPSTSSTASIQPQSFGRRSLKTYDRLNSTGSLPSSFSTSANANNTMAETYGFQRPSYLSSTSYTPTTPTISSTPFISRFSRSMSQGPPRDTNSTTSGNSWIGRTNSTITRTAAAAQNDKIIPTSDGDLVVDNSTSSATNKEQNEIPKDNNTGAGNANANGKLTVQEKMQNYQNYYQSLTGCPPYRRSTFLYSSGPSEIHQKSPEIPEDLNPSVESNSYSLPRRKSLKKENNFEGDDLGEVSESTNFNSQIPTTGTGNKWPTVSLTIRQHRPLSIASFPRENGDVNPIRSVKSPTPQREMVSRIMSPPPPSSVPVGVQNTPDFVVNPNEIVKKSAANAVKLKRDTSRATSVERITRLLENKTMSPTKDMCNIVRDPMSPKGSRPQSPTVSNSTIESGNVSQNTSGKSTPTLQDYQDQIYQQQQQQPSLVTMAKSGSRTKVFKPKFIANLEKKWEKFTSSEGNLPANCNGDLNEPPVSIEDQPAPVELLENAIPEETITESRLLQRALSPEKKPLNIIGSRASKFGSSTVNFMLGKFKKFEENPNPAGKPPKPYVGARSDSVLTLGQNTNTVGNFGKKIMPKSNGLIIREQSPAPEGYQDDVKSSVEKRTKIPAIEGKVRFNRDRETSEPPCKNSSGAGGESVFCKISEQPEDQKKQYVNKYTRPLSMISPVGSRIEGNSSTGSSFIPRFQKQSSMPPPEPVSTMTSTSSICEREPKKEKVFETNSSIGRNSQELSPSPNNSQSDNSYGSSNSNSSEKTIIDEEKQSVRDRIHRKSYFNRFNSLDRKKSPSYTNSSSNSSSGVSSGGSSRLSTNSFGSSSCINKYNPNPLFKELITDSNGNGSGGGRKAADYTRSVTSSLSKLLRDIESDNGNGSSSSIPEESIGSSKGKNHMYKKSLTNYHFNSNLPSLSLDAQKSVDQKHTNKRNISPVD